MSEPSAGPPDAAARLAVAMARLRRRVRVLQAERSASFGLAIGLCLCVLLRLADLTRILQPSAWWYPLAAVLPAAFAWAWAFFHPPQMIAVAAAADARLGIKDRASSAVALRSSGDPMTAALVEDAAAHVGSAAPREVFRRRLSSRLWPPAAAGVALALAILLPQWPALQSAQARTERAELKAKAKELNRIADEIEKRADTKTEDIAKQVAENLRRLGKDLDNPRTTPKRALVEMKETAKQIAAARDKIEEGSPKKLAQAGAELQDAAARAAMAQQSERMRDLRELAQLKQAGLKNIETLEQLKELKAADFQKFRNLNQLKGLSEEQIRRLAALAERARARDLYADLKMPQELLDALSELFAKEDYLKALELMQTLMEKLRDRLKAQQSGKAPKLTPEELKRLQEDLAKLAEMLKGTNLDELAKRLRELAEELSKMDIEELLKKLKECEGCAGFGVGLGLLPDLGAGMNMCGGSGPSFGVGPGDGMAKYIPGITDRPSDVSQRVGAKFYDVNVPGQVGDKGETMIAGEVYAPPSAKGGQGKVPYYRVLPSYREQAEDALRHEEVPPEHRARVKRYFDSLTTQ